MSRQPLRASVQKAAATAAIAVGLVAGGVGIASAATSGSTSPTPPPAGAHAGPGMDRDGARGTVTAITPTSITITGFGGTATTYTISSSTTFTKGSSPATASDVTVGARVDLQLTAVGSTTVASVRIDVPRIGGTVTAVNGNTITIIDEEGFWRTVSVSSSTTYAKGGSAASLADVTVGQMIRAEGSIAANHTTLDATSVNIGKPAAGQMAPGGAPRFGGPGGMDRRGA